MLVVFGSINLDLVAHVARLPGPGETIAGESFAMHPGGKGANQALAARRAGADVVLVGAVGNDAFAAPALRNLVDAGVDLQGLARVDAPTGVALIHVDGTGENSITLVAGANAHADPAILPDSLLAAGATLLMQLEVPFHAVHELAVRARKHGARVILNAAPAHPLSISLLSLIDVLVVNEIEAAALSTQLGPAATPEAFALDVARHFGCATAVTVGAAGAFAVVGSTLIRASAPVLHAIDTTGAGDAFTGVLAAALHREIPWNHSLAMSVAAGSLACTAVGAQAALPAFGTIDSVASTVESNLILQRLE
jgi:ribokinase